MKKKLFLFLYKQFRKWYEYNLDKLMHAETETDRYFYRQMADGCFGLSEAYYILYWESL